ncbi:trans-aconitate 2-methyltransferase [Olivibacter sp. XZL3]|uniref:class I SAM-dependent methyltransferase n=1 Tax=Olivibacter sp. XZL3 TaxID=1735116 RepID=UPI001066EEE0|nr:class I SAM-dependent methyltransferase [Olivibacter sp. XZL3]
MDKSNGYDSIARTFIEVRGQAVDGIGTSSVRKWAQTFAKGSTVLDLGCGTGMPISNVLLDEGLTVYGIDASATMIEAFKENFPDSSAACEAAEESTFFNRQFDGIIAWGLLFLLSAEVQKALIPKVAKALQIRGKFLFTAPSVVAEWEDTLTGRRSVSLGAKAYREILTSSGLSLIDEFEDERNNHYYHAVKKY